MRHLSLYWLGVSVIGKRYLELMFLRYAVFLCVFLIFSVTHAYSYAQSQENKSERIRVIFSSYTAPYVFKDGTGIVIDIVKEALQSRGYEVVPVFLPIGRGFKMFADRKIEATSIIKKNSGLKNAFYSDYFMQYHNYAITRKDGPRIDSLADLSDLDIIAFQNACLYLGKAFAEQIHKNKRYKELPNQETQVLMLLSGRTQVAVMDISIFKYYRNKLISEGKISRNIPVVFNNVFEPTKYRMAFVDYKIRNEFNGGLKALHESGRYSAIYDKYIDKYFKIER